ncbi:unnamed protein product [Eretmochelys imbricata]
MDSCDRRMASGWTPLGSSSNFTTDENRRGLFASHTTNYPSTRVPASCSQLAQRRGCFGRWTSRAFRVAAEEGEVCGAGENFDLLNRVR